MRIFEFRSKLVLRRPISEVFSFFQEPSNLSRITPPEMGFQIITPAPISMKEGALIDYIVKIGGVPVRWTSYIAEYNPPDKFVDVQLKGPYAYWHHAHLFSVHPEGVQMEDVVHYALPGGWLGEQLEPFLVRPQLKKIFDHRQRVIAELFS